MSGLRKTGKSGQILMPQTDGNLVSNAELVLVASKEIGGKAFANRFHGNAMTHWNKGKAISVRLQGIVGEAGIEVDTGNDKVKTGAFGFYKDDGDLQDVAAASALTVTRPAAAKKKINLIVVDINTKTVSVVVGTDGDDFSDMFGAAGGPPLVGVDKLIIGAVKLGSEVAAPVTASEIVYSSDAGAMWQERSDMPTYEIIALEGGVLFTETLLICHTGSVSRKVYGTFYSQKNVLLPVAHTTDWKFSGARGTTKMEGQGDESSQSDFTGPMTFTASFGRFRVDAEMFKLARKGYGYLRMKNDRNDAGYYEGATLCTGFDDGAEIANPMKNNLSFEIDGTIEWRDN